MAVGFDSTLAEQMTAALVGLAAVMLGWFAFAMTVCWAVSSRLRIDRHTDGVILKEIDRLRAGGAKTDVDAETRAVVESLTGVPYDRCWA